MIAALGRRSTSSSRSSSCAGTAASCRSPRRWRSSSRSSPRSRPRTGSRATRTGLDSPAAARGPARPADPDRRPGAAAPDRRRDDRLQPGLARRGGAADRRRRRCRRGRRRRRRHRARTRLSPQPRLEQRALLLARLDQPRAVLAHVVDRVADLAGDQQRPPAPGRAATRSSSTPRARGRARRASAPGSRITGIRSWIGRIELVRLAGDDRAAVQRRRRRRALGSSAQIPANANSSPSGRLNQTGRLPRSSVSHS